MSILLSSLIKTSISCIRPSLPSCSIAACRFNSSTATAQTQSSGIIDTASSSSSQLLTEAEIVAEEEIVKPISPIPNAKSNIPLRARSQMLKPRSTYTPDTLSDDNLQSYRDPATALTKFDFFKATNTNPIKEYRNIGLLSHFVSQTGKILPRKETGLCAKNQRMLKKVIKRGRAMGLLPYMYRLPTPTVDRKAFIRKTY